jgi:hypothetical protein
MPAVFEQRVELARKTAGVKPAASKVLARKIPRDGKQTVPAVAASDMLRA